MRKLPLFISLVCSLFVLGVSTGASAEPQWIIGHPSEEVRSTDLSFGAAIGGGPYLTPGVMLGIPLVDGGFIRPINDSLFLEPGVFAGARWHKDESYVWIIPEIGPRWNFHLTPNWDVFATIKAGVAIGRDVDIWLRGTAGMAWWINRPWALRLETGAGHLSSGFFIGATRQF